MPKNIIFDRKNVVVIGGAGFIGSHLCDELVKESKVICIDNFSSGVEKNIDHLLSNPNFAFINHDINKLTNLETMESLSKFKIKFQGIQEIYNLACPMSPKNFLQDRENILLTNSIGIKNILDLVIKYKCKFVHFSSSVVYGSRQKMGVENKITETELGIVDNLSERSSYDEGKRFSESFITNYASIYGIDAKIIRLFRVYGPRMKLNDDQLIPEFINNALDNKDVVIFGDESFSSAFCYVSDVVDSALKIMNSNVSGPVNIGSDLDVKLKDIAQMIINNVSSSSKIVYQPEKMFLKPLCLPDIRKARNELSWMPVVTLENGIEKTIFDLRANRGLRTF